MLHAFPRLLASALLVSACYGATELGELYNPPWANIGPEDRVVVVESVRGTTTPMSAPTGTGIDSINGYKSVRFGMALDELAPRLRPRRTWDKPDPFDPNGSYVLRVFHEGEQTYGDVPVKVTVKFVEGVVDKIEILFLKNDVGAFLRAFREKYGPPNDGTRSWLGKDVGYYIHEFAGGGASVEIRSVKQQKERDARVAAERARRAADDAQKAKQMKRDF